jgi:putative tryptophan/tyrosine transport system substrate-binding protein
VFEDATQQGHVAKIFDVVERTRGRSYARSRRSPRIVLGRSSRLFCVAIAGSFLFSNAAATAEEKNALEIGVLAIGPRNIPTWHCGQQDYQPGTSAPLNEAEPFYVPGLRAGLEKLNYVEDRPDTVGAAGRRFRIQLRMGTPQQLRAAAKEFVEKKIDLIVAIATVAVRIAQEETRDDPKPILFPGISDPISDGFVESLAHPGGYITGVSHQQVQGSAKRVELFQEMLPGLHRMITLRRPGYGPSDKSMVEIRAAAERLKIEVLDWTASDRTELQNVLKNARKGTADGIMILPDAFMISNLDLLIETSLVQGVPIFGIQDFMADWGALAAYGPSTYQAGARVAGYIDKIVKGAKPGDLPVEPIDPMLVVNMKAAECLGVSLPLDVLSQADRVIR